MSESIDTANSFDSIIECLPLSRCDGQRENPTCLQHIEAAIINEFTGMGYPYVRFTSVQLTIDKDNLVPSFSINLSTYPESWEKRYDGEDFSLIDPLYYKLVTQTDDDRLIYGTMRDLEQEALADPGLYGLDQKKALSENGRLKVYESMQNSGIHSGLYVLAADGEHRTVFLMAKDESMSNGRDIDEAFWRSIIGRIIHIDYVLEGTRDCQKCDKHLRIAGGEPVVINRQQIDILRFYLQHAKATAGAVAESVHLSESTVNYHLKEIRKKFNMPKTSGYALAEFSKKHRLI
jgi:DNA-binding CsgD family transcriptional regulator